MQCSSCGAESPEAFAFCGSCGARANGQPAEVSVVAPQLERRHFTLIGRCVHCGNGLPYQGPMRTVPCGACGGENAFHASDVARLLISVSRSSSGMECRYVSGPNCHCGATVDAIPVDINREVSCGRCGDAVPAFAPPAWLQDELPALRQIIGGERDAADRPAVGLAVSAPSGVKPVVLGCPDCKASLKVDGDTERTMVCQFCNANVYLPDDLWRLLHPVARARAWTIVYEGNLELRHDIEWREAQAARAAREAERKQQMMRWVSPEELAALQAEDRQRREESEPKESSWGLVLPILFSLFVVALGLYLLIWK